MNYIKTMRTYLFCKTNRFALIRGISKLLSKSKIKLPFSFSPKDSHKVPHSPLKEGERAKTDALHQIQVSEPSYKNFWKVMPKNPWMPIVQHIVVGVDTCCLPSQKSLDIHVRRIRKVRLPLHITFQSSPFPV
jgi:hypothetical protein